MNQFQVIPIIILCDVCRVFDFAFAPCCHSLWLLLTSIRCKVFVLSVWEQAILWFSLIAIIAYLIMFRLFGSFAPIIRDQPFHLVHFWNTSQLFMELTSARPNRNFYVLTYVINRYSISFYWHLKFYWYVSVFLQLLHLYCTLIIVNGRDKQWTTKNLVDSWQSFYWLKRLRLTAKKWSFF